MMWVGAEFDKQVEAPDCTSIVALAELSDNPVDSGLQAYHKEQLEHHRG
jgi:hypothetical protein